MNIQLTDIRHATLGKLTSHFSIRNDVFTTTQGTPVCVYVPVAICSAFVFDVLV
jgi:hypothetical protein